MLQNLVYIILLRYYKRVINLGAVDVKDDYYLLE